MIDYHRNDNRPLIKQTANLFDHTNRLNPLHVYPICTVDQITVRREAEGTGGPNIPMAPRWGP